MDVKPAEPEGYLFVPQDDITVSELSQILVVILTEQRSIFQKDLMTKVPATCARHFVDRRKFDETRLLKQLT